VRFSLFVARESGVLIKGTEWELERVLSVLEARVN